MSMLGKIKQNKVVADFSLFRYAISGRPKVGKTSLIYEIVKEKFNGDLSKLLLFGFEVGYNALDGIHAVDIEDWDAFVDLVDELVDNKEELSYKLVAMDTVDIAQKMCEKYILQKLSIADGKQYKVLQDVGYGKAHNMVETEFIEQIQKLDKAGFNIIFVTHDKDKTFTTRDGQEYQKTTLSLSGKIRDVVLNMVDFVIFIETVKEKVGKETKDMRYIYLRSDGDIECGARFSHLPDRIPYSAKGFIDTVENAILSEYNGDKTALETQRKIQLEEHEEKSNEYIDKQKNSSSKLETADELISYLQTTIGQLVKNEETEKIDEIKSVIKKHNNKKADYTKMKDVEGLKAIAEFVDSLK